MTSKVESRSSLHAALEGIMREWFRVSIYRHVSECFPCLWTLRQLFFFVVPDQPGALQKLFCSSTGFPASLVSLKMTQTFH